MGSVDVKGLNLSTSLIPTWDGVARIISNLPLLESLNLEYAPFPLSLRLAGLICVISLNRFARLDAPLSLISSTLKDLHLNKTTMSWDEVSPPFLFLEARALT